MGRDIVPADNDDDEYADSNQYDRIAYHTLRKVRDKLRIELLEYDLMLAIRDKLSDDNVIRSLDLMVKCVDQGKVRLV